MKIKQLSKHMADLIAAGEVVERPMSVVKELLENAIDAKSTQITVEIQNGGISYIRIADNGVGMSKDDAPVAFLRHATSKISTQNDLDAIKTLGFRGEALAAISSVSKIDLFTKQKNDEYATFVNVLAGEVTEISETGANDGTTIIVRDLFYNTPARMKFLKKDYTEASYIASVVENLALSHPSIAFKLIKDNKMVLNTQGNGDLKSVIYNVLGKEDTLELLEVKSYEINGIKVYGYVSKPSASKGTRAKQHFFVNGRYIKSKTIFSALETAYKNSLMTGKFPYGVINIEINESLVDVNVHPTKTEVKFANEKQLFEAVYFGVKETIETGNIIVNSESVINNVKSIILDEPTPKVSGILTETHLNNEINEEKVVIKQSNTELEVANKPIYNPFNTNPFAVRVHSEMKVRDFKSELELGADNLSTYKPMSNLSVCIQAEDEKVYEQPSLEPATIDVIYEEKAVDVIEVVENVTKPFKFIGECFKTYIMCEYDNEVILIDKHAAHERLNFNKLIKYKDNIETQVLLTPQIVNLSAVEYAICVENLDEINKLGFEVEDFKDKCVVVRQIPMILDSEVVEDLIFEIIGKLMSGQKAENDKIDDILHSVACKSAIKGNKFTSSFELEELAKAVIFNEQVNFCPHGRPVKTCLTKNNIEKMFKRIV